MKTEAQQFYPFRGRLSWQFLAFLPFLAFFAAFAGLSVCAAQGQSTIPAHMGLVQQTNATATVPSIPPVAVVTNTPSAVAVASNTGSRLATA